MISNAKKYFISDLLVKLYNLRVSDMNKIYVQTSILSQVASRLKNKTGLESKKGPVRAKQGWERGRGRGRVNKIKAHDKQS